MTTVFIICYIILILVLVIWLDYAHTQTRIKACDQTRQGVLKSVEQEYEHKLSGFRAEAVRKGYAKWVLHDMGNGRTVFTWNN